MVGMRSRSIDNVSHFVIMKSTLELEQLASTELRVGPAERRLTAATDWNLINNV